MRSYWVRVGPNLMNSVLLKREIGHRGTWGKKSCEDRDRDWGDAATAMACQPPAEAERDTKEAPRQASGRTSPANTWSSGFQPPKLWGSKCLLFEATAVAALCYSSPRTGTRAPSAVLFQAPPPPCSPGLAVLRGRPSTVKGRLCQDS